MTRTKWFVLMIVSVVAGLAVPSSAFAGRLWVTGHDADYHCSGGTVRTTGQCNYLLTAVDYVRGKAPNPKRKVLVLDNGRRLLDGDMTALGVPHDTVDPRSSVFTQTRLSTADYSAILVASDASCGGCDLNASPPPGSQTPDSDAINARTKAITSFFNAGGGVLALSGGSHGGAGDAGTPNNYYAFLPLPVEGAPVLPPFCLPPFGKELGLFTHHCPTAGGNNTGTSEDLNYATHNSFNLPRPGSAIKVAENDSAGKAETLVGEGKIAGDTIKDQKCSPGPNTSRWHIFAVTIKCVLSGKVFSDPDLKLKASCVVSIGTDIIPVGKLKILGKAAGKAKPLVEKLRSALRLAHHPKIDHVLRAGWKDMPEVLQKVTHPHDLLAFFATSHVSWQFIRQTLSKGTPVAKGRYTKALARLKEVQDFSRDLLKDLSGITDVQNCVTAFRH